MESQKTKYQNWWNAKVVPPKKAWNIRDEYFTEMCLENPGKKYYIICIYAEATKNW